MRGNKILMMCAGALALWAGACSRSEEARDSMSEAEYEALPPEKRAAIDPLGYSDIPAMDVPGTWFAPGGIHIPVRDIGKLYEVFNDSNKYQYACAERVGITPMQGIGDAYRTRRPLRRIAECDAYALDTLEHSVPYLVPEAADLLDDIGAEFQNRLKERGGSGYKVRVTSVTRTPATVKSLRRVNRNASDSSCHKFGTTFDISWARFAHTDPRRTICDGDLKNLLAEVLYDLRAQGRCLVKFEQKQCCFHITATGRPRPQAQGKQ